ncbi:hypothetical protein ACQPYK_26935 [Streptosporangium sp. CA-135522]|uniref:hypothetical protein n=1 Tax=Streptosporangium sp. CA-135522 TaxID=3240072 RepID=UPI003D8B0B5E
MSTWTTAHGEPRAAELDDGEPGDQPIAAGLRPMSIAERSALIAQAVSLLAPGAGDPSTEGRERRELEAGLCHREIELYEDLAAEAPGDPDVLAALAGARARLAELRADAAVSVDRPRPATDRPPGAEARRPGPRDASGTRSPV